MHHYLTLPRCGQEWSYVSSQWWLPLATYQMHQRKWSVNCLSLLSLCSAMEKLNYYSHSVSIDTCCLRNYNLQAKTPDGIFTPLTSYPRLTYSTSSIYLHIPTLQRSRSSWSWNLATWNCGTQNVDLNRTEDWHTCWITTNKKTLKTWDVSTNSSNVQQSKSRLAISAVAI